MANERKRQARAAYKERAVVGGVYSITNTATGRRFVKSTQSMAASRSRFEFAQTTGLVITPELRDDWCAYGAESFVFEVLEELEMNETQTPQEFANDLKLLKELWLEKDRPAGL